LLNERVTGRESFFDLQRYMRSNDPEDQNLFDLIMEMLDYEPNSRIPLTEALQHSHFKFVLIVMKLPTNFFVLTIDLCLDYQSIRYFRRLPAELRDKVDHQPSHNSRYRNANGKAAADHEAVPPLSMTRKSDNRSTTSKQPTKSQALLCRRQPPTESTTSENNDENNAANDSGTAADSHGHGHDD